MKQSLWQLIAFSALLGLPAAAVGQALSGPPLSAARPAMLHAPSTMPVHPAVVRIFSQERGSQSLGSGTLIDVRDQFGLIVTNWHVIRGATGEITVAFPDGFRSAARVLKTDQDWDLAVLSIWRPPVVPIRISSVLPQPREPLTIAGYGSDGVFRAVSGPCTQYLAPSANHPHEIVELAVQARQGDSGGPILNQRGELAGVLFGSIDNTTAGSYGGRVLKFLEPVLTGSLASASPAGQPGALPVVSVQSSDGSPPASAPNTPDVANFDAQMKGEKTAPSARTIAPLEPVVAEDHADDALQVVHTPPHDPLFAALPSTGSTPSTATDSLGQMLLGHTPIEQAKAALSLVGLCTLVTLAFRWGRAAPKSGD